MAKGKIRCGQSFQCSDFSVQFGQSAMGTQRFHRDIARRELHNPT
jgi:hypothetical protein